jgi:hypothetical protein
MTDLTPVTSTQRIDLGDGITLWLNPVAGPYWRDTLPNHRDAALKRCALRYSRRRDAQTVYAKALSDLVHDVRRGECDSVPADMAKDLGEMLEAIAIDAQRASEVRERALACVGVAARPVAGGMVGA